MRMSIAQTFSTTSTITLQIESPDLITPESP